MVETRGDLLALARQEVATDTFRYEYLVLTQLDASYQTARAIFLGADDLDGARAELDRLAGEA